MSRRQNFCVIMNDGSASTRCRDDTSKGGLSILLVHMDSIIVQSERIASCVNDDAICIYMERHHCCVSHYTPNAKRCFFSSCPKLKHIATRCCIACIGNITNG